MKSSVTIKDGKITDLFNLDDGSYDIDIKMKSSARTYEQIKKLWATINDISRADYGDISESENIYFQILQMAGVRTDEVILPEEALKDFRKKVRTLRVISHEIINHRPMVLVNACMCGISEMNKKELSSVIETTIRYANEKGIKTEL